MMGDDNTNSTFGIFSSLTTLNSLGVKDWWKLENSRETQ